MDLYITHFSLRSPYLIPVDNCELCLKFGEVALFNCNLAVMASSPLSTGIWWTHALHQRGLNAKRPTLVFFLSPTNLFKHMDRQAHTGDTVLAKSKEETGRNQKLPWWLEGGKGRQKTLAPLPYTVNWEVKSSLFSPFSIWECPVSSWWWTSQSDESENI